MLDWIKNYFSYRKIRLEQRRKCLLPSVAWEAGDRVRAKDHKRIDSVGGKGTVIAPTRHRFYGDCGFLVKFDSMPDRSLFMAGSELEKE